MGKKRFLITSAIIISVLAVAGIVFAATTLLSSNSNNYAVEIVDDGSKTSVEDESMKIQTKAVQVNDEKDEVTYETTLTNLVQATKEKEISIVVDTSYSMEQNAEEYDIKATTIDLATNMLNNINGATISLVDNTGIKSNETTSISSLTNTINNLQFSNSATVDKGIEYAYKTFKTNKDNDKYVVILTDATDTAKAKLQELEESGVKVYSILVDVTSTEFGNPEEPVPAFSTFNERLQFRYYS